MLPVLLRSSSSSMRIRLDLPFAESLGPARPVVLSRAMPPSRMPGELGEAHVCSFSKVSRHNGCASGTQERAACAAPRAAARARVRGHLHPPAPHLRRLDRPCAEHAMMPEIRVYPPPPLFPKAPNCADCTASWNFLRASSTSTSLWAVRNTCGRSGASGSGPSGVRMRVSGFQDFRSRARCALSPHKSKYHHCPVKHLRPGPGLRNGKLQKS
jgi:hypothetical protein